MTDEEQGQLYDVVYEMRGFAATLLAASRGDLQEPDKIIEYAASQIEHLADRLVVGITGQTDRDRNESD